MTRCRARLEGGSGCEAAVVLELYVGCAVEQQSMDTTLPVILPEFVRYDLSSDTERGNTFCAVGDDASHITEP